MNMAVESPAPSASTEDYLKAVFSLQQEGEEAVSTNDLAEKLGISAGSVSAMVKRLDEEGLVEHVPYRGVTLTPSGERLALRVLRRHRLLELFLTEELGVPWNRVHEEAEVLEHAISDDLIERIAEKLGDPGFDPHGDPIPSRDLVLETRATEALSELDPGTRARFVRISDQNPEMLSYLSSLGIALGDELQLVAREPFEGPCRVRAGGETLTLGVPLASAMQVQPLSA
jgi:DtxR family Mn-dependent transcriptional regulator